MSKDRQEVIRDTTRCPEVSFCRWISLHFVLWFLNPMKKISTSKRTFRKQDLTILETQQRAIFKVDLILKADKAARAMQPHARQAQFRQHANLYYGNTAATTAQDATASAPLKPVAVRPAASQQTLRPIHLPTALQAQAPAPHNVVFLPPAMMGQLVCAWQLT